MSDQAIKFKESNPNIDYKSMSIKELQKLPSHNGIINFKITETSFLMLNILNDDSTIIKYFWHGTHDLESLDVWFKICKENGLFIDVGAHTGLYCLTCLKANEANSIVCFEPYFMNMARLISNLRLNGFTNKVSTIIGAVSDFQGKSKFKISTEKSYLSKGGRLDDDGFEVDVHTLDNLYFDKIKSNLNGIKIDTEGEDYKVLLGAEKLINKYKPKIIIEVRENNKEQIRNFLKKYNYEIYNVSNLSKEIELKNYNINNVANIFAK